MWKWRKGKGLSFLPPFQIPPLSIPTNEELQSPCRPYARNLVLSEIHFQLPCLTEQVGVPLFYEPTKQQNPFIKTLCKHFIDINSSFPPPWVQVLFELRYLCTLCAHTSHLLHRPSLHSLEMFTAHFFYYMTSQSGTYSYCTDSAKAWVHSKVVFLSPQFSSPSIVSQPTLSTAQSKMSTVHVPDHWSAINFFPSLRHAIICKADLQDKIPRPLPSPSSSNKQTLILHRMCMALMVLLQSTWKIPPQCLSGCLSCFAS